MKNSFEIPFNDLYLIEPYRFELNISPKNEKAFLTFQLENSLKESNITFRVVDSDILIEELFEIQNGIFVKANNKIIDLIESFIYNKNVF